MHNEFRQLRYMVRRMEPATARHPRAAQRAQADELAHRLGGDWRLTSRSHSRGLVAVAGGNPPITALGLDVEHADPRRPWSEIAAIWLPEAAARTIDASTACRGWTFGEAHLKAFGRAPDAETLLAAVRTPLGDDEPIAFGRRCYWHSEWLPGDFWLTLVWQEAL